MATRILLRTGPKAQLALATLSPREPWYESDTGRNGVGTSKLSQAVALATLALSTAGTTTLALESRGNLHTGLVTIAAGGGAYVRQIILPGTVTGADGVTAGVAFQLGDFVELRIEVAGSANPTVNLWHNAAIGAALTALAGEAGVARNYLARYRHDGAQWREWDLRQVNP